MNLNSALKKKNKFAKAIREKLALLPQYNVYQTKNKEKLEYNTKDIVDKVLQDIDVLVATKTAIAKVNVSIYNKIFRMAELKGLVTTLRCIPVKQGLEYEGGRAYSGGGDLKEVEYASTLTKKDIDVLIEKFEGEIEQLQADLDRFNFTNETEI